ncbi:MAG: TrkH family potassium uptake protein [Clostridia bacterium]|nr:TrkH family potassium uptake protein [Clostridia bacterium]
MNRRMILNTVGKMVLAEGLFLLLPASVALIYNEPSGLIGLLIAMAVALGLGGLMMTASKPKTDVIYAKEGFFIVSASWILLSLIGALPFVLSGEIPNYIDALFETVSGFTTTGASILTNVESMSHGLLFWRSFTHWIGGMGVLVFAMAILPNVSERSIHIMRAEMPGPVIGKLVPRIKDTAKILYLIYIVLTFVQIVFLLAGGMPLFDSVLHAFGTAGTGGFGVKADSITSYSPYLQWVITVFMLIFGINFNLYYLILIRRAKTAFKSRELWAYGIIVAAAILGVAVSIRSQYPTLEETVRLSAFQVSSIITTTGYATADFNLWPSFAKGILILLMFVGGCAGSTAGGFKVSRVVILFKQIRREVQHMLHPRSVKSLRFEGHSLEEQTIRGVLSYLSIYLVCFGAIFLVLSAESGFDFETTFTASFTCFNNVGPGLGGVGPASNFAAFSPLSKLVLSGGMLLGRLEIFPLIIFFSPSAWRK